MDGFNENDTIPSFNSDELIEEVNEDDADVDKCEDEEDSSSASDSYGESCSTPKRFKTAYRDESLFKYKVMKVLKQSCEVAGDFAVSGKLERIPLISILLKNTADGGGQCIKFPLNDHEATNIVEYFEPSPYGKGTETVFDSTVRNSFQLSPDGFEILNSDWDKFIKTTVVDRIKKDMSLQCTFVPSLYKLLLYQSGSFCKSHRDSEKEDNMFATLVVQLPTEFKGGQLVVRHDGKAKLFDFSSTAATPNNSFSTFYSAFYCDCEHEILPVTEGCRLCLVYNLIVTDAEIPIAPRNHALEMELIRLLQNWEGSRKMVFALKHKYSEAGLSFKNLKTTDKIVADILRQASTACDLNIFLAAFEKDCSGYDESGNEDDNCRGCASDFDGEFDEEGDEVSYQLNKWIADANNEKITVSALAVDFKREVIPIDCFDTITPHEQNCEHTGNEGVQITKAYRCAAIAFWPKKFTFHVLRASNAPQNLLDTFFIKESEKYFGSDCKTAETKAKILEWAKLIASEKRHSSTDSVAIVNTIIKFNDIELIQNLICNGVVCSTEAFSLICSECDKYGWKNLTTSTVTMFKALEQRNAIKDLSVFVGDGNLSQEKNKLFAALLQVIFDKGGGGAFNNYYYSSAEMIKQEKEEKDLLEPLVNAVLKFNDLQLIQNFVKYILPLNAETILQLVAICEKYGWEPFVTTVADKFKDKPKKSQVPFLTSLILNGVLNDDKKTLCITLFRIMFDKCGDLFTDSYHHTNSTAEKLKRQKDEKELLEPLLNAVGIFNDVQLIKNIFQRMTLHSETIPMLISQSKIHGWNAFATEISSKFEQLAQIDAIDTLSMLLGMGNFKEEKILCFNLFQMILGKNNKPSSNNLRRITQEEQSQQRKQNQQILYSICCVAENIQFNLSTFAKGKSFKDFVPVLLRLVKRETKRLSPFWAAIALHFIGEMGRESIKPIEISWRHSTINAFNICCNDCISLNSFLGSVKQQETFKIGEKRRKHLQQRIDSMAKLSHRTELGGRGQIGVLVVTKTEMGGAEAIEDKVLSSTLLEELRSVLPYN